MNVLLLYPEFPETFWSFKHALKFVGKRAAHPPLGLLTVASLLPAGWNVRLVDTNVGSLSEPDLAWADIAMIGCMAVQRDSARELIDRCADAGVTVVAGGPLFTEEHEFFPRVDHFVLNEAEVTLPRFLADLAEGRPARLYSDPAFADLGSTPPPRWELADLDAYASMSVQYSRGCPFDCDFCNVTALFGHRPRTKSAEQILSELDALWELGWRGRVFFVDDNLIGHRRALREELLPALIEWRRRGRRFDLYTEASINLADDARLMEMMVRAGFDMVFVGIETPSEDSLAECSKTQNTGRDLVEDVKRIQRAGMQVQGGFIVGFDHDTPSIFQRQIDLIQESGIVTAMVGMLQAPFGTRLYERLEGEGRLLGRLSGDNVDGTTNILPRMGLDPLRDGYRQILETIYSPDNYYRRVRTFLKEYRRSGTGFRLRPGDLPAFLRSVYHLGVKGRERVHYWKLLGWTLFRRPRYLDLAVTMAVYGHHFRKVCELRVA